VCLNLCNFWNIMVSQDSAALSLRWAVKSSSERILKIYSYFDTSRVSCFLTHSVYLWLCWWHRFSYGFMWSFEFFMYPNLTGSPSVHSIWRVAIFRVRDVNNVVCGEAKSIPLRILFTIFSAIACDCKAKFYQHIQSSYI